MSETLSYIVNFTFQKELTLKPPEQLSTKLNWRTSLATVRQDKSPTTRRFAYCPVVASANTTHKSVTSQPPYIDVFHQLQSLADI
jgi:hypothetical protein